MPIPAQCPGRALPLAFLPTGRLLSTLSATECCPALFEASQVLRSRPTPHVFPDSFVHRTSCRGPGSPERLRAARGLPGSDVLPSRVVGSSTTAERRRLAYRCRSCCLRRVSTASASACCIFRGSITHPARSLCTLRRGRHLPPRNTRYQAGATPYLGRTSTGWITPASLAHGHNMYLTPC